jgi:hypothetical protein
MQHDQDGTAHLNAINGPGAHSLASPDCHEPGPIPISSRHRSWQDLTQRVIQSPTMRSIHFDPSVIKSARSLFISPPLVSSPSFLFSNTSVSLAFLQLQSIVLSVTTCFLAANFSVCVLSLIRFNHTLYVPSTAVADFFT